MSANLNRLLLIPLFDNFKNKVNINILAESNNNNLLLNIIIEWFQLHENYFISENILSTLLVVNNRLVHIDLYANCFNLENKNFELIENKNIFVENDFCIYLYDLASPSINFCDLVDNYSNNSAIIFIISNLSNSAKAYYLHQHYTQLKYRNIKLFVVNNNNQIIDIINQHIDNLIIFLPTINETLIVENYLFSHKSNKNLLLSTLSTGYKYLKMCFCKRNRKTKTL